MHLRGDGLAAEPGGDVVHAAGPPLDFLFLN
jgi:hypothetical protein